MYLSRFVVLVCCIGLILYIFAASGGFPCVRRQVLAAVQADVMIRDLAKTTIPASNGKLPAMEADSIRKTIPEKPAARLDATMQTVLRQIEAQALVAVRK